MASLTFVTIVVASVYDVLDESAVVCVSRIDDYVRFVTTIACRMRTDRFSRTERDKFYSFWPF